MQKLDSLKKSKEVHHTFSVFAENDFSGMNYI